MPRRTTSVSELIAAGENSKVEFKSTARWHLHKKDRDPAIEQAIVKTVAGFLNAGGGTLLIGVNDQREAVGLENDYKFFKSREHDARDSYQNWLMDLFENAMGKPSLANISIDFEEVDGKDVCRIDVKPSSRPVFVLNKDATDLYVRVNASTRLFNTADAFEYISTHWRR